MNPARSRALAALVAVAVFLLDRSTKNRVETFFRDRDPDLGRSVELLGDAVRLTYVQNRGVVFGLFGGSPSPYRTAVFTVLSLAAIGALLVYFFRLGAGRRCLLFGLALVLGGAVGNFVDRLRLGYVIDFIDVSIYFGRWHVFNVADTAIVIGVGLMLIDLYRHPEPERWPEPAR